MDELVREALREGRLTVAGGGPAALYTPWAAGFEEQYPGITVQVRGAFSSQLVAGIDRQLESGAPAVDVAILQTLQDFVRWKAAGALLKTDIPAMGQSLERPAPQRQGRSLGQIAAKTGIPKTPLHRHLASEAEPAGKR